MTNETAVLYVVSTHGRWHIAAHSPSGYGIRALCGRSWRQGDFRTHGPGIAGPVCKRCSKILAAGGWFVNNTASGGR